jgi:hypothetical protein
VCLGALNAMHVTWVVRLTVAARLALWLIA